MHEAERALSDKQAELAKMMAELDERSMIADSQKVEIVALQDAGRGAEGAARQRPAKRSRPWRTAARPSASS